MRRGAKPGKAKVDAKSPVARKLPKNDASGRRDLEKRLAEALKREAEAQKREAEALEQQTATAEILRVIAGSPTDVQPVLDVIARSAARLCSGYFSMVGLSDGERVHVPATYNLPPEWRRAVETVYPVPITGDSRVAQAIRERRVVQVLDVQDDPNADDATRNRARISGYRTWVGVPMVGSSGGVGVIAVARRERKVFSDREIALLETFADQAVIAIENVRLFKELEEKNRALTTAHSQVTEALEQQTATAEILRVISRSPTDLRPVMEAVAENAARLCDAPDAQILRGDGETITLVASYGRLPTITTEPRRISRRLVGGRAIIDRMTLHISDVRAVRDEFPDSATVQLGVRTVLATPLLREGVAIGVILIRRMEVRPFSDNQIALLQTFADQAVIAIENVRLFKELEASNQEIAEKNRQIEAASQHKSEFLANMSHELRTPLNAIIGFSEVLTERMFGELNDKQDEYLKDIHASGQHLLSLINDILDLSKIEAGRMELELTEFDLPNAIENALILVRERATRRGITLGHSVDDRLGTIQGDERKVKQVLLNLLSNALKFTPEGGRIDVSAGVHDEVAEIAVADTGVGIAPEDQETVFEEFRQVGTAEKKIEGTGLGLALSRKFIELHGGRIWVKSELGTGSTFTFTLPVRRGE
jgi:signal transduction histidine kinase